MLALAAALSVFIAVTLFALAVLGSGSRARVQEARISSLKKHTARHLEGRELLTRSGSTLPGISQLVSRNKSWSDRAALDLQQGGIRLKVTEYLLLRLLTAVGAAVMLAFLIGGTVGLIAGIVGGVVGFMAPAVYVVMRRERRKNAIQAQLVETLGLISNSLRSGFAFTQAMELAAKQVQPPMQDELNTFLRDMGLGAASEDALRGLVERTGSLDMEMVVTTILVQRTTGGNLSEILDNVTATVRERERLQGEIRALTAQQRLTGQILSVYPLILGIIFTLLSYDLMKVLWEEDLGRFLLGVAITLQVMGALTIRQILKLEV